MSKNFKKFLLLWSGELISSIGGGLTSFGLTVYVFSLTGSAASTAVIALLAFLPNLLLGIPAGVLADRIDRRLMMMLGDGLSAIGLVYILICMLNGGAQMWQICLGITVSSVFSSLIVAAICFGIVSYGHFYRGRVELGLIFAVLTVAQLTLAVMNYMIFKKNK